MTITVEATYENGTLKLSEPLPLREHEKVQVTINDAGDAVSRVRATAGLIDWKGDPEILRRIAEDDEFGILESP